MIVRQGYSLDFFGSKRASDSEYIHWIWPGIATRSGSQVTAADGNLDFTIIRRDGRSTIQLSGPTSMASMVAYEAGDEVFNIRFKPGVYLAGKRAKEMLDEHLRFTTQNSQTFWFGPTPFSVPTFESAEDFVSELLRLGLLMYDPLVTAVLSGRQVSCANRTIQHHFLHTIGLSHKFLSQVRRAEDAVVLLQQGCSIMDVVCDMGYSDQAHMTHALKRFTGFTPAQQEVRRQDW